MYSKFPVVIAFRVTDKLFIIRKESPRRVGYGTKWDHKAWLIPDLIIALHYSGPQTCFVE